MAVDPFASDVGLDVAQPVAGLDPFAPDPNAPGPFKRGFGAGVSGVKSSLYGAGALAAHTVGATGVEQAALAKSAEHADAAAAQSQSLEQVDWTSPGSIAKHFAYLLGNAVPSLATMAVGGVVGRGLGALAGRGMAPAAAAAIARAGGFTGAIIPDIALEAGGIYPEALKTGVANPATRAAVGGAAAASLDFLPLLAAEKYLTAAGKGGFGAMVKGALKGAPVGGALEGTQEALQSVVERGAAGQSLTDAEAVKDYKESFAGGFAPGLLLGAGIGASRGRAPVQQSPAFTGREQPADVNTGQTPTVPAETPNIVGVTPDNTQNNSTPTQLGLLPNEQPLAIVPPESPLQEAHTAHNAAEAQHRELSSAVSTAQARVDELEAAKPSKDMPRRELQVARSQAASELSKLQAQEASLSAALKTAKDRINSRAGDEVAARILSGINSAPDDISSVENSLSGIIGTPQRRSPESLAHDAEQARVDAMKPLVFDDWFAKQEALNRAAGNGERDATQIAIAFETAQRVNAEKAARVAAEPVVSATAETPQITELRALQKLNDNPASLTAAERQTMLDRSYATTTPTGIKQTRAGHVARKALARSTGSTSTTLQNSLDAEGAAMIAGMRAAVTIADSKLGAARGMTPERAARMKARTLAAVHDAVRTAFQHAAGETTVPTREVAQQRLAKALETVPGFDKEQASATAADVLKAVANGPLFSKGAVSDKPFLADKSGKPITLYHGTDADIRQFRNSAAGGNSMNQGMYGRGAVYATGSVEHANGYAAGNPQRTVYSPGQRVPNFVTSSGGTVKEGANVMPLHIRMANPFVVHVDSAADATIRAMAYRNADAVTTQLKDQGHDGVVVYRGDVLQEVVPFSPGQVESAISGPFTTEQLHTLPEQQKNAAVDAYDQVMRQRGEALIGHLRGLIGNDPNLIVNTFTAAPGSPIGGYTRTGPLKSVISMALNAKNELSIADHEGFHYAEDHILDVRERAIVRSALSPSSPLYKELLAKVEQYDRENGTHVADEVSAIPAEARAYAFEFWRRGELQAESGLARVFAKLKAFFEKIANFVKGLGFTNYEDIFVALARGQFAERERSATGGISRLASEAAVASPEALTGNRAWIDATKPYSSRALSEDFFGSKTAPEPAFSAVQLMMLEMLKHNQVSRAVVQTVPVNVVDILASKGFTPEQFISQLPVVMDSFPVDHRATILAGFGDALAQVSAGLRTVVLDALSAGDDRNLLPTLRASDLDPREVVGLLSPRRVLGGDAALGVLEFGADYRGLGRAEATTESTKSALDAARESDELSATQLAALLNLGSWSHKGETGHLHDKFIPPDPAAQKSVLFSKAAVDMDRQFRNGELEREQYFIDVAKRMDDAGSHLPAVKDIVTGIGKELPGVFHRARMYVSTGNYISKFSQGYKNVVRALEAQESYKDRLVSEGSTVGLSRWHDASQADRDAAFEALLKRRVQSVAAGSPELNTIRATLTPAQRSLFDQVSGKDGTVAKFLNLEFESERGDFKQIMDAEQFAQWEVNRRASIDELINTGYIPERRYGEHTVRLLLDVVKKDGSVEPKTVGLEHFDTAAAARVRAQQIEREMKAQGSDIKVVQGIRDPAQRDSDLSLRQFLDIARRQGIDLTKPEVERLSKALLQADSTRRNRMMQTQHLPGMSKDGWRVLNEFVTTMSGKVAHSAFSSTVNDALDGKAVTATVGLDGIPKHSTQGGDLWRDDGPKSGYYKGLADKLADRVLAPGEGSELSTKLKTSAMTYFIGGSLGAGVVQAFSVPMNTLPYLSMHTDYQNAFTTTLAAWSYTMKNAGALRDLNKLKDPSVVIPGLDPNLRQALTLAAQDGTNASTEIHQIMGISRGGLLSQSRSVQRAMEAWMAPFKFGENTSRVASFIAAFKIGQKNGLTGPALYQFAKTAVDETQNRFDPVNRPVIASHPIGSLLFMFKSFPLFVVEMIETMYRQNPKSAVYMLLGLVAMTGVQGLPFAEDILDLVEVISQKLFNSPFNPRRAMRNVLKDASEALVGVDLSNLILRGAINDLTGLNIATRVGNGDMLPGTRIGAADTDYGRAMEQILGAPFSMVVGAGGQLDNLAGSMLKGDFDGVMAALRAGGPVAVRNAIKGVEQFNKGYAEDARGQKLVDVSGPYALWQAVGMSSAALQQAYDTDATTKSSKAFYKQVSTDMEQSLVKALREGNTDKVQEIYEARDAWNKANPEMPLMSNAAAVRRSLALGGLSLPERTLRMLPRQLRAGIGGE